MFIQVVQFPTRIGVDIQSNLRRFEGNKTEPSFTLLLCILTKMLKQSVLNNNNFSLFEGRNLAEFIIHRYDFVDRLMDHYLWLIFMWKSANLR